MSSLELFDPIRTTKLFFLKENFNFLKKLIFENKFPQVTLLTGEKGLGKSTLVFHLMHSIFNKDNYDIKNNEILKKDIFFNQLTQNFFSNIIFLNGNKFKSVKVDDIRLLKETLLKSSIIKGRRFIILDDIESFNLNSLNSLLKIIEEPNQQNYFILINNKSKTLLETIKSRCVEIKFFLSEHQRNNITSSLIKHFNQEIVLDNNLVKVSPGNFLRFNYFFIQNNINMEKDFSFNFNKLLNIYKKEKDLLFKDLILFFIEYNLQKKFFEKNINNDKFSDRLFIIEKINDFFSHNLNQKTLINAIESKFINE